MEIDSASAEMVLEMQESWRQIRECSKTPGLRNEDLAVYEVMENFESLDCRGLAVLIEGRIAAFALGEPLNPETAVIHIEKADPEIRGLYAAVNQMFCRDFWAEFEYVNREQDLGVEGLRRAKESYQPHHLVEKFIIRLD